jgi:hypothetical protein
MSKRDEYIEKMKQQLDELNDQLGKLELKAQAANEELHAKYSEQMDDLRKMSSAAQQKMDEIRQAGEDRWESLVEEAEKVHKAFVHSFNYFKSQLK